MLKIVFIAGAVFIAVLVVIESMKRKNSAAASESTIPRGQPLTADESGPTQTGRFRVAKMLQETEKKKQEESNTKSFADDSFERAAAEEEESLPDPFSDD